MRTSPKKQNGFIQNLIVPGLLAMGVVIGAMSQVMNTNAKGQAIAASVDLTRNQLTQIRRALTLCRTIYPAGNNQSGFNPVYPTTTGGTWESVRVIKCPATVTNDGINLWVVANNQMTAQGMFLSDWEYRNTAAGGFLRLRTAAAGDTYGNGVLTQVAARLHADEKTLNPDELLIKVF